MGIRLQRWFGGSTVRATEKNFKCQTSFEVHTNAKRGCVHMVTHTHTHTHISTIYFERSLKN